MGEGDAVGALPGAGVGQAPLAAVGALLAAESGDVAVGVGGRGREPGAEQGGVGQARRRGEAPADRVARGEARVTSGLGPGGEVAVPDRRGHEHLAWPRERGQRAREDASRSTRVVEAARRVLTWCLSRFDGWAIVTAWTTDHCEVSPLSKPSAKRMTTLEKQSRWSAGVVAAETVAAGPIVARGGGEAQGRVVGGVGAPPGAAVVAGRIPLPVGAREDEDVVVSALLVGFDVGCAVGIGRQLRLVGGDPNPTRAPEGAVGNDAVDGRARPRSRARRRSLRRRAGALGGQLAADRVARLESDGAAGLGPAVEVAGPGGRGHENPCPGLRRVAGQRAPRPGSKQRRW